MKKIICLLVIFCSLYSCKKNEIVTGTISGVVSGTAGVIATAVVELLDSKSAIVQSTTTDSKGVFTFTKVKAGTYTLEVHKDNYADKTKSVQVTGSKLDVTIDIQKLAASIQGRVKDGSSNYLAGVTVTLLQNSSQVKQTTSDNTGNFQIDDVIYGTYQLKFEKTGFTSVTQDITVSATNSALTVTIQAKKGDLTILITDNFSGILKNAKITLKQNTTTIATNYSGTDGSYKFTAIAIGSYTIEVTLAGFVTASQTADLVEAGTSATIKLSPESAISGGILSTKVTTYNSSYAAFEMDVFVTNAQSAAITNLTNASFTIDAFTSGVRTFTFLQNNFYTTNSTNNGPYSAGMLIDQSGSISSTDPNNARIQSSKIFLGALKSGDNAALAAFSSYLSPIPVVYGGGFTSYGNSLYPYLDQMANNNAGNTPLYQAIYNMINYTYSYSTNSNKAVIVFTDGGDTDGGRTISEIASLSVARNVKVYTIGLSSSVNTLVLGEIASKTGGAFMWASDAKQLVSMYGNLGNILRGSAFIYRISWSLYVTGGVAFPGTSLTTDIKVVTSNGTFYIPFYIAPGSKSGDNDYQVYSSFIRKPNNDN
jgi:hypothetical protein